MPVWARPGPVGMRLGDKDRAAAPAILRFDHDDFIQEYITTVQNEPERLGEWIAQPETWRQPMSSPAPVKAEAPQVSTVAFLYDQTHSLALARKPVLPDAVNLQAVKNRARQKPLPTPPAISAEQLPLKLYQAGQKRHYLVSASLISEEPGLPDREPEPGRQEKVGFVIRRLLPADDDPAAAPGEWDEYAFFPGSPNRWRRIGRHGSTPVRTLADGEERLPMFPVSYQNSCGQTRTLFNGSIPVSRREQWVGAELGAELGADGGSASAAPAANAQPGSSLASLLFQADVAGPWKALLQQAERNKTAANKSFSNFDSDATAENDDRRRMLRSARDVLQTGSWYVLLDFASFLQRNLPGVWQVLEGGGESTALDAGERALVELLQSTTLSWELGVDIATYPWFPLYSVRDSTVGAGTVEKRYDLTHLQWNLAAALVAAAGAGTGLEAVETTFSRFGEDGSVRAVDADWPDFLFPLADPEHQPPVPAVPDAELGELTGAERMQAAVDALARMIDDLLPAAATADAVPDTVAPGDPRAAWFVVRCVYLRPCCGPLFPPLLSTATQKFQMAPFFDPDAPARPVRIPMPVDISPAGLRKYQKNTGFVISDMLCGKIRGIRRMTFADLVLSVLPWPFHKDLPDASATEPCGGDDNRFGMICSLSIPIVTLCALILMMIMVALFDLFFRWIPYLIVCLPIPGLKAKASG
jgi:hypothetical protein